MDTRLLASGLLTASLLAAPAAAQETEDTRESRASTTREQKAASPGQHTGDKFERLLDFVERDVAQRIFNARDGFGVRFGGIESGSGFALGPMWRTSSAFGGSLHVHASAAASIARDHEVAAGVALPELVTNRVAVAIDVSKRHLTHERFFGEGPDSVRANETTFALDRRAAGVDATVTAARWLRVSAGARLATLTAANGTARGVPGIDMRWTSDEVPGLDAEPTFAVVSLAATADLRDVPGNPRRGGRYHVAVERHSDTTLNRYSFSRVNVELEQHLSGWRRQRTLTLRAIASLSEADAGHDVPMYLQPTLGGSRLLRGFVTDRFRDRNALVMQAEYGWDIWPFLNAVLFYEGGVVAPHWREIAVNDFRRDYGIGFRLGSARTVALRTDVALGSGEGTRIAMRFSHAF